MAPPQGIDQRRHPATLRFYTQALVLMLLFSEDGTMWILIIS